MTRDVVIQWLAEEHNNPQPNELLLETLTDVCNGKSVEECSRLHRITVSGVKQRRKAAYKQVGCEDAIDVLSKVLKFVL